MKVFSSGGGVQSTAALVLSAQGKIDYPVHIFANVGAKAENPATLAYVEQVLKPYAARHGIEFYEVQRTDDFGKPIDLYDYLISQNKIPIPVKTPGFRKGWRRACTRDWKIRIVQGYTNGASVGLGISLDEISRAKQMPGIEYPLIELELNRHHCELIVSNEGLPSAPKSSCWFCPFTNIVRWQELKRNQPQLFTQAVELEKFLSDRNLQSGTGCPVYFTDRGASKGATLDQAVADQLDLFENWGLDNCESGFCMV